MRYWSRHLAVLVLFFAAGCHGVMYDVRLSVDSHDKTLTDLCKTHYVEVFSLWRDVHGQTSSVSADNFGSADASWRDELNQPLINTQRCQEVGSRYVGVFKNLCLYHRPEAARQDLQEWPVFKFSREGEDEHVFLMVTSASSAVLCRGRFHRGIVSFLDERCYRLAPERVSVPIVVKTFLLRKSGEGADNPEPKKAIIVEVAPQEPSGPRKGT